MTVSNNISHCAVILVYIIFCVHGLFIRGRSLSVLKVFLLGLLLLAFTDCLYCTFVSVMFIYVACYPLTGLSARHVSLRHVQWHLGVAHAGP